MDHALLTFSYLQALCFIAIDLHVRSVPVCDVDRPPNDVFVSCSMDFLVYFVITHMAILPHCQN